ncbi:MAG: hypothetical protein WD795_12790 [Woeseia sp.]
MQQQDLLNDEQIAQFASRHRLPDTFSGATHQKFLRLAAWISAKSHPGETLIVAISGAQGAGKSTLADFLQLALETGAGLRVAALSLDDFYLTKAERAQLGAAVHPLLVTRGVPGTHDLRMLSACLRQLRMLAAGQSLRLPRFDKAEDDRAGPADWAAVSGPVDAVVLEGWCLGIEAQAEEALAQPVNSLEYEADASGEWRRFVNDQLAGPYAELFAQLDLLVFLKVPNIDAAYRWRREQERKLAGESSVRRAGIMSEAQVARFVQHFERVTRAGLASLPLKADAVLELNDQHDGVRLEIRE